MFFRKVIPVVALLSAITLQLFAQHISTVAGCGIQGFAGDGGKARAAKLNKPLGMAEDAEGNMYIADNNNDIIRKVTKKGIIATFAGTGEQGYYGDHGPAQQAKLHWPNDVIVDHDGNVLIIDQGNNCIRKVDKNGIITTIAGRGSGGFSGDGGPATNAELLIPTSLTTDAAGNIYLSDAGNERIRKINKAGIINTIAGNGQKGYTGDGKDARKAAIAYADGIANDGKGNIYFVQREHHVIRRIDKRGKIVTVAGTGIAGFSGDGGPAISARLNKPYGIVVDDSGVVYFADNGNNRIRKIDKTGKIATVAGNGNTGCAGDGGNPVNASFCYVNFISLAYDGGLLVADAGCHRIRKISNCPVVKFMHPEGKVIKGKKIVLPQSVKGGKWSSVSANVSIGADGSLTGLASGPASLTYTTPDNDCDQHVYMTGIEVVIKK